MQNFRRDILKQWMSEAQKRTTGSIEKQKTESQEDIDCASNGDSDGDSDIGGSGCSGNGGGNDENQISELEDMGDGDDEQRTERGGGSPQSMSNGFPDDDERVFNNRVGDDYFCHLSSESHRRSYSPEEVDEPINSSDMGEDNDN
ncbi:unnamed protein product [Macrosiphum euphorbiae]|uniref:Uncharacterized protein n=1 Tax=Macrosiphum euphorbiae TaxID=13131 RepID=A0AAV0Y1J4_9HEMI|nr:unnamed protein product [Macrosiphum euphorbiae]